MKTALHLQDCDAFYEQLLDALLRQERNGRVVDSLPVPDALRQEVDGRYVPALVLAGGAPAADLKIALLRDRGMIDGRPTAYVCRARACQMPTADPAALAAQLEAAGRG